MNSVKRELTVLALLPVLLGAMVAWSYSYLDQTREQAGQSLADLEQSQRLAARIEQLRHQPAIAGSSEIELKDLALRIEQAAKSSQIAPEHLVLIQPQPPRRVDKTVYLAKPTHVRLMNLNLQQAVTFLHTLVSQDAGLKAQSVSLLAPRSAQQGQGWTLDATLTHLIYAPPNQEQISASGR